MEAVSSNPTRIVKTAHCLVGFAAGRLPVMSFATRLKEARERAGMTQQQLASALNIASSTVHRYERGQSTPNGNVINALAETVKCEPSWLLNGASAVTHDEPADIDPTLADFLKSKMGRTATDDEVAQLQGLSARNGRPSIETYQGVLAVIRGTMQPDPDIERLRESTGAMVVKRKKA